MRRDDEQAEPTRGDPGAGPARLAAGAAALGAVLLALPVASAMGVGSGAPAESSRSERLAPLGGARASLGGAAAAGGPVLGGGTSQGWPVVVSLALDGRRIERALAGLALKCTPSGDGAAIPDQWRALPVSRSGAFDGRFGPESQETSPGVTDTVTGSISGRFNRARTRARGTWRFTVVERNSATAINDTCDSGVVRFTVRR
jgi:hypothetical protein